MFGLFKKRPRQPEPDYATLYIADPSLIGSKTFDAIAEIQSYEGLSEGGSATGLRLRLSAGEVAMNFMPGGMVQEHLEGLAAYAQNETRSADRVPYVLSRIGDTTFVIGCVVPMGFDDRGKVIETLLELNAKLHGLLFLRDSLIDHDGQPLAGPACDS